MWPACCHLCYSHSSGAARPVVLAQVIINMMMYACLSLSVGDVTQPHDTAQHNKTQHSAAHGDTRIKILPVSVNAWSRLYSECLSVVH